MSKNNKKNNSFYVPPKSKGEKNKFLEKMKKFLAYFSFSEKTQRILLTLFLIILAIIIFLSFFDLAGWGGQLVKDFLINLYGDLVYIVPFLLFFLIFFVKLKSLKAFIFSIVPLTILFTFLLAAFLTIVNLNGGRVGYLISGFLVPIFDEFASAIIFLILIVVFSIFCYKSLSSELSKLAIFWKGLFKNIRRYWQRQKPFLPEIKQLKKVKKEEFLENEKEKEKVVPILSKLTQSPTSETVKSEEIVKNMKKNNEYKTPPIDLLTKEEQNLIEGNIEKNQLIIKKTLESFNIPVEMSDVSVGPTVTQYTFKPLQGIKLSKIVGLSNDLALALAAHPIRVEAPVPGKSLVGIEVPNKIRTKITLRSLLEEKNLKTMQKYDHNTFYIPLGKDVAGVPVYFNLFKMPHLLVAGATGTGKTVFLNSLIASLIFRNSPDVLKLILIDPKRVEFANYNDLPHLLCPVISNPNKAINILNWLIIEMERRFDMLLELGVRDIESYNKNIKNQNGGDQPEIMPYIVLILDELADLMNVSGKEIEAKIMRLAQKARAIGIHLVLATQRPSVNVITGVIKANIVARVAFTVVSQVDSRTILDCIGAEKLTGDGDMLFLSPTSPYPKRIQGAYISAKEMDKIVDWISCNIERKEDLSNSLSGSLDDLLSGNYNDNEMSFQVDTKQEGFFYDPLYEEAKKIIVESDRASTSLLQRRLKIGYARAARLIDVMEQKGVVGPARGSKPRKILIEKESN